MSVCAFYALLFRIIHGALGDENKTDVVWPQEASSALAGQISIIKMHNLFEQMGSA